MRFLIFFLGLVLLTGCDSASTDSTYGPAGNYTLITVPELETVVAGNYNTDAFVMAIEECPPGVNCILPDHIMAAQSLDASPNDYVMVEMVMPSQMTLYDSYRISVEVRNEPTPGRYARLIGYDEHESLN